MCTRTCVVESRTSVCFGSSGEAFLNLDVLLLEKQKMHNWNEVTHFDGLPSPVEQFWENSDVAK